MIQGACVFQLNLFLFASLLKRLTMGICYYLRVFFTIQVID